MDRLVEVATLTIDCVDAAVVADFWCALLDYEVVPNDTDSIATRDPQGHGPPILFTWAGSSTSPGKNRLHLDLRPSDQGAAVDRALALGAQPVDIAQTGNESWVVLQDPEGNEFCLLQSPEALRRWRRSAPAPRPSR